MLQSAGRARRRRSGVKRTLGEEPLVVKVMASECVPFIACKKILQNCHGGGYMMSSLMGSAYKLLGFNNQKFKKGRKPLINSINDFSGPVAIDDTWATKPFH